MYKIVKRLWKRGRERVMERCYRAVYGETVRSDYEKCEYPINMTHSRSDHSLELRGSRCRIGLESDGLCRMCGLEFESTSAEHVVESDACWRMREALSFNSLSDLYCYTTHKTGYKLCVQQSIGLLQRDFSKRKNYEAYSDNELQKIYV